MKWDSQNIYDRLYTAWAQGRLGHAYLLLGDQRRIEERIYRNIFPSLLAGQEHQVHELFGGGESGLIGVDETREFLAAMARPPATGSWRIGLIAEAQSMTAPAANALLKTLEEPGQARIFFLQSPQKGGVLSTIASRCQSLPVRDAVWQAPEWIADILGKATIFSALEAWAASAQMARLIHQRRSERAARLSDQAKAWQSEEIPTETLQARRTLEEQRALRETDQDWRDTLRALSRRWPVLADVCDRARGMRSGVTQPDILLGSILLRLTRP